MTKLNVNRPAVSSNEDEEAVDNILKGVLDEALTTLQRIANTHVISDGIAYKQLAQESLDRIKFIVGK